MIEKMTKKESILLKNKLEELENRLVMIVEGNKDQYGQFFCDLDGDFRETPDHCSMSTDREFLEMQIADISNLLSRAEIVDNDCSEVINLGSKFGLNLNDVCEKYVLTGGYGDIMAYAEYTPVSKNSPLGKAVLGLKENDSFSFKLPNGKVVSGVVNNIIVENVNDFDKVKEKVKKH